MCRVLVRTGWENTFGGDSEMRGAETPALYEGGQ